MTDIIPIESRFDNPECRPNSGDSDRDNYSLDGRGRKVNHGQFLEWIRAPKIGTIGRQSDGFLSVSHLVVPAYECPACNFHGMFESQECHRCGVKL